MTLGLTLEAEFPEEPVARAVQRIVGDAFRGCPECYQASVSAQQPKSSKVMKSRRATGELAADRQLNLARTLR